MESEGKFTEIVKYLYVMGHWITNWQGWIVLLMVAVAFIYIAKRLRHVLSKPKDGCDKCTK